MQQLHRWDLGDYLRILACSRHRKRSQELIDFWLQDHPGVEVIESITWGLCPQCQPRLSSAQPFYRRITTWLRRLFQ